MTEAIFEDEFDKGCIITIVSPQQAMFLIVIDVNFRDEEKRVSQLCELKSKLNEDI